MGFTEKSMVKVVKMVKVKMVKIENNKACFVLLWRKLERTRRLLRCQYKRYSIRNVLKVWYGPLATDDFIWEVCQNTIVDDEPAYGNDLLLPPSLYPRKNRELLRAIVIVSLGLKTRNVKLHELDAAYSLAFPHSTPINVNKKRKD
jgi:hypothetical protein